MLKELINHSPDLQLLLKDGYEMEIVEEGFLLIHNVPYVTPEKVVKRGTLVSNLYHSGGQTIKPQWHAAFFIGEYPSSAAGARLNFVVAENKTPVSENYVADFTLSAKADYADHYQKMLSYLKLLTHQADELEPGVTAATYKVYEPVETDSVFEYADTNSTKALIHPITKKLKGHKIAIIGLGGTGSYILDILAKTPVNEIHLFDGDTFFQHNAFRAPGAAPKAKLYDRMKKTDYFRDIYANMHKGIVSHPYDLGADNLAELDAMTTVFLSMDPSPVKKLIIDYLMMQKIPVFHTGIGLQEVDGGIRGQVKVTVIDHQKHDHVDSKISFAEPDDNVYDQNIQIADLNALNAIFAVIRWKKMLGFYKDKDSEYFSNYVIYTNEIHNSELPI
jgi:hypothetical protein